MLSHGEGDLRGAVAAYREAIRLEPTDAGAWPTRQRWARPDRLDEAIPLAKGGPSSNPITPRLINLGVALSMKDAPEEAVTALRRAIELTRRLPGPLHAGQHPLRMQAWDDAVDGIHRAIRCKPDFAEAHCNLGHVLREKGRFRAALAELRLGHDLGSKDPQLGLIRPPSGSGVCKALIQEARPPTAERPGSRSRARKLAADATELETQGLRRRQCSSSA